ncbi:hypothetical protein FRC16_004676 [Serendipita sp. 398]|nr:hypothetical protein FRC16_004676 [Serendipita sp. 398]
MARAILKRTKILLMDEATASVDYATDELIGRTIRHEFADSTILTIAHRIRTIIDYDRVMVLDRGRIVEFNKPSTLLADKKSHFYSLCKATGPDEFSALSPSKLLLAMDATLSDIHELQSNNPSEWGIDHSSPVFNALSNPYLQDDCIQVPDAASKEDDTTIVELAIRTALPPSTSTLYVERSIYMQDVSRRESDRQFATNRHNASSLAPVDGGFGAWSFLFAAFLVELIVWGFPNAFGTFLDAYLRDPTYTSQKNAHLLLPMIGTMTSGIIYCSGKLIIDSTLNFRLTPFRPGHIPTHIPVSEVYKTLDVDRGCYMLRQPLRRKLHDEYSQPSALSRRSLCHWRM